MKSTLIFIANPKQKSKKNDILDLHLKFHLIKFNFVKQIYRNGERNGLIKCLRRTFW